MTPFEIIHCSIGQKLDYDRVCRFFATGPDILPLWKVKIQLPTVFFIDPYSD